MISRRREIRGAYAEALAGAPGVRIFGGADDAGANCWLSALIIDPAVARADADLVSKALEAANIEARPLWKPMHLQPVFSGVGHLTNGVAESLFRQGVTLPSGSVHGPTRSSGCATCSCPCWPMAHESRRTLADLHHARARTSGDAPVIHVTAQESSE